MTINRRRWERTELNPGVTSTKKTNEKRAAPRHPRAGLPLAAPHASTAHLLYYMRHDTAIHQRWQQTSITDKEGVRGGCGSTNYVGTALYSKGTIRCITAAVLDIVSNEHLSPSVPWHSPLRFVLALLYETFGDIKTFNIVSEYCCGVFLWSSVPPGMRYCLVQYRPDRTVQRAEQLRGRTKKNKNKKTQKMPTPTPRTYGTKIDDTPAKIKFQPQTQPQNPKDVPSRKPYLRKTPKIAPGNQNRSEGDGRFWRR